MHLYLLDCDKTLDTPHGNVWKVQPPLGLSAVGLHACLVVSPHAQKCWMLSEYSEVEYQNDRLSLRNTFLLFLFKFGVVKKSWVELSPVWTGCNPVWTGQQPVWTGQRAVGTGQRAVGTGQRAVGTGQRQVGTGQRTVWTGQRPVWLAGGHLDWREAASSFPQERDNDSSRQGAASF